MAPKNIRNVFALLPLFMIAVIIGCIYMIQPDFIHSPVGVVLNCAPIALILGVFAYYSLQAVNGWLTELEFSKRDCIVLAAVGLGLAVVGCIALEFFFQQERDIKIYDFTTFWTRTVELRSYIENKSIHEIFAHFRLTSAHEYTSVAALPLALASYAFGLSYAGYCQSIFVLYYLPTCLLIAIFAMRLVRRTEMRVGRSGTMVVCLCLCLLSTGAAWPLLNGYVDIIGILFVMLMMNMTLDWDGTQFDWRKILGLALLSVLTVLSRRFFAFYIAGFFFSFGAALFVDMIVSQQYSLRRIGRLVGNMVLIAGTAALVFAILNQALFHAFFGRDYAQAYSAAFKYMTTAQNLFLHARQDGWLWFFFSCLGAYLLFTIANVRLLCFRIILAPAVAFFLFRRVQDMYNHHAYIIISAMMLFLCVFALLAANFIRTRKNASGKALLSVAAGVLFVGYCFNFFFAFDPKFSGIADTMQPVTTVMRSYPKKLSSFDAIMAVTADLRETIGNSPERLYVGTVGPLLSPDYILRSEMPEKISAVDFILRTNNVDLRDGFPSQAFLADYMMFQYPYFQEFATQQEIVYQLFDMVVNSELGREYYRLEKEYPLSDEYDVRLYRKIRETTPELVDELKNRLREIYPDNPEVYTPSYFVAFAKVLSPSDYTLNINHGDIQFLFTKGKDSDAAMQVGFTGDFSTLSFRLNCWGQNLELVMKNQEGEIYRSPIGDVQNRDFSIDIAGSDYLDIVFSDTDPENRGEAYLMFINPELK